MDQAPQPSRSQLVAALREQRWAEALGGLELWCMRTPDDLGAWLNRGYCLVKLERVEEALACFDHCLRLEPSHDRARQMRHAALERLGGSATVVDASVVSGATIATAVQMDGEPCVTNVVESAAPTPRAAAGGGSSHATAAEERWQPGRVVAGRYEIRDQARGGMGVVSFAWDRELERMVAIKTPHAASTATDNGRARFLREAEAWVELGLHPHVCCAYYVQEIEDLPRLIIEYVDGGSLDQRLRSGLDFDTGLDVAVQIASALDYTHGFRWRDSEGNEHRGLIHRDVKPANVLMTTDGQAKLTDFGLVRAADDRGPDIVVESVGAVAPVADAVSGSWQTVTEAGGVVGTPPYMAPELWRPSQRPSSATDIYALGCMLYEMLCGRRPFVRPGDIADAPRRDQLGWWLRTHVATAPPDPRFFVAELDPRLADVVLRCLAKDPAERPAGASELRAELVAAWERRSGRPYPRPVPLEAELRADSRCNRGVSFLTLGQPERAEREWREALAVDPEHPETVANLTIHEWRRPGLTDAEVQRRFDGIASGGGRSARVRRLAGRMKLILDDPAGAISLLREDADATGPGPTDRDLGVATVALAQRSSDAGLAAEGERLVEDSLRQRPGDVIAGATLAVAARLQNRGDEANAIWDRVRPSTSAVGQDLDEVLARWAPELVSPVRVMVGTPIACLRRLDRCVVVCRTARGVDRVDVARQTLLGGFGLAKAPRRGRTIAALADATVVLAGSEGPLLVVDPQSGRELRRMRAHPGQVVSIDGSGSRVVTGASDRRVRLWNAATGELEATFEGHGAYVTSVAFDGEAKRVVSASADGTLRLWSLDGSELHVLRGHGGAVNCVVVDAAVRRAISGGEDGTVRVWDLERGAELAVLTGHGGPVQAVTLVDGDRAVVSVGRTTARVWDLEAGAAVRVIRPQGAPSDVVAVRDDRTFALAVGREVQIFRLETRERRLPWALAEPESASVLGERGATFKRHLETAREAVAGGRMVDAVGPLRAARSVPGYGLDPQVLVLWGRVLAALPTRTLRSLSELRPLRTGGASFTAARFAPDSDRLLTADSAGDVLVWTASSGHGLRTIGSHSAPVIAIAVMSDGRRALTADRSGVAQLWDLESETEVARRVGDGVGIAAVVAVSGDAAVLGLDDGRIVEWARDTAETERPIAHLPTAIAALAAGPDARFVLVGGWDDDAVVLERATGRELMRLRGHTGTVSAVALTPDGRRAVTAAGDGTVRVWGLRDGVCGRVIDAHPGGVVDLALTPDARWAITGGRDGAVKVWELRSSECLASVEGGAGALAAVALSDGGDQLLAAGSDGLVRRWFVDREPGEPEPTGWDDRARPFLATWLRRWQDEDGVPRPDDERIRALRNDLSRRGFGWLDDHRLRRELDGMVQRWVELRRDDREDVERRAQVSQRQARRQRAVKAVAPVTHNLGLRLAGAIVGVVVVLLLLLSLRSPAPDKARPNAVLWPLLEREVAARGHRFREGGWIVAYQDPALARQAQPAATVACPPAAGDDRLNFALYSEDRTTTPPDAVSPDLEFQEAYRRAVVCTARLADDRTVREVIARVRTGLHPRRQHDMITILVGAGAAGIPRLDEALGSGSEDVRHVAAFSLVQILDPRAQAILEAALNDRQPSRVEAASFVLRELIVWGAISAGTAFDRVQALAKSIDPRIRRNGVRSLVLFEREGPALGVLEEAAADEDPMVREAAAWVRRDLRDAKVREIFGGD